MPANGRDGSMAAASVARAPILLFSGPMSSGLEDRFQTLHEIVRAAKLRLPAGEWDYLMGGTETETTLRRNRLALDSIAFRPRVLRNVSKVDTNSTLLGRPVRFPVMFATVGSGRSFTTRCGDPAWQ